MLKTATSPRKLAPGIVDTSSKFSSSCQYTLTRDPHGLTPKGARLDRLRDSRGPHRLSPFFEGRAQLPSRPCASGGRGRPPRGGALVGERLQPPAVGAGGDPGP